MLLLEEIMQPGKQLFGPSSRDIHINFTSVVEDDIPFNIGWFEMTTGKQEVINKITNTQIKHRQRHNRPSSWMPSLKELPKQADWVFTKLQILVNMWKAVVKLMPRCEVSPDMDFVTSDTCIKYFGHV